MLPKNPTPVRMGTRGSTLPCPDTSARGDFSRAATWVITQRLYPKTGDTTLGVASDLAARRRPSPPDTTSSPSATKGPCWSQS